MHGLWTAGLGVALTDMWSIISLLLCLLLLLLLLLLL
jgi:hypothetical protein